jgi:hypothetical protein
MVEQDRRLECAIRPAPEQPCLLESEEEHPRLRPIDAPGVCKALGIAQGYRISREPARRGGYG